MSDLEYNKKFLNFFTEAEICNIVENATVISDNSIIIMTEKHFFELSVGDKLGIYCEDNNKSGDGIQITRNEFMKLYQNSIVVDIPHIKVF